MTSKSKLRDYYQAMMKAAERDKDWEAAAKWARKLDQLDAPKTEPLPGQTSFLDSKEGEPLCQVERAVQAKLF